MQGSGGSDPSSGIRSVGSAIITPDAVGLDLDVATLGSRGAAYLLDAAILLFVLLLFGVAQALLGSTGFVSGWFGIAMLLLLAFLWQFGYPIGFEVLMRGRTPGKLAMGLRVVTVEGAPVGLRHAVIRASVGLLELFGTVGVLAMVSSFASERGQRLGDLAAGTLVVRERRGGGSPTAEVFAVPAGLEAFAQQLDVSGLQAADYAAVRAMLLRSNGLPSQVRERVAAELAGRLVARVRPAPPTACSATDFLRCVAVAVQARRSRRTPRASSPDAGGPSRPSTDPSTPRAAAIPASSSPPVPTRAHGSTTGETSEPAAPGRPASGRPAAGGFAPPD